MTATERLREEHEAIKSMLEVLESVCQKLESGEKVNSEHLDQILEFFKVFADRCHHGKEEVLLFPAMEEAGIPGEGGPIGVMLVEHDAGRDLVNAMSENVAKYRSGDDETSVEIAGYARDYITLLRQHIDKEDKVLFPMAEAHISSDKQIDLLEEFEKVEHEIIGIGKHEEFEKLLAELEAVYVD